MAFRNSNGHAKQFTHNLGTRAQKRSPALLHRPLGKNERSLVLQLLVNQEARWKRVSVNQERILLFVGVDEWGEEGKI